MLTFAREYTAAWCSHDPDRVAAFYSTDGTLTINGGAPHIGRAAVAASAKSFFEAFPDLVVALDAIERTGHQWVYRWTLTGTNTGPGGTGRRVRISGSETWTLDADGLVATSIGSFDAADYARQLDGR